jgi:S1-C subfamily serine protease
MPFGRLIGRSLPVGPSQRSGEHAADALGRDNIQAALPRLAKSALTFLAVMLLVLLSHSHAFAQQPGRLGAVITDVTLAEAEKLGASTGGGAYVVSVTTNGPAEAAGVLAKDLILDLDDTPIRNVHDLECSLARTHAGDRVTLTVLRSGQSQSIAVILDRWPNTSPQPLSLGACDVGRLKTGRNRNAS